MSSAELLIDSQDQLGEGPIWDERAQALYWVDIHGRAVKRFDGKAKTIALLAEPVGSIALRASGGLLAAMQSGLYFLEDGEPKLFARPSGHPSNHRFNDGRCDRAGRFWVGTLNDATHGPTGTLYCFLQNSNSFVARTGISVPNSLSWSPDGRTMYFADSPRHKIWAFDYDPESAQMKNERLFATPYPGFPDGSCVDADGCLWNAEYGGARVVRYTPQGKIDRVIAVPADNPTCCCFGGAQLDTLYITTAQGRGVYAVRPGSTGLAEARFAG